jgi:hypothetical protein
VAGTKDLYFKVKDTQSPVKRPGSAVSNKKSMQKMNETIETAIEAEETTLPIKPTYPQFEEQLKEIREGYAKEYEERIKRGLQELTDLKSDIS